METFLHIETAGVMGVNNGDNLVCSCGVTDD